jgi:hypothetical protein
MKFIRTFENFTEMDMGHQNMETMCADCQCNMAECECGSPMAYEDDMEDEYPNEMMFGGEEGEEEMMFGDEDEEDMMNYEEEEDMMGEEGEEEMMPSGHRMGHIMSFQEAKKAKPDFLDLDKDGDKKESMKKAAADKKKGGKKEEEKEHKEDDKKSTKKSGLSKAQEKLPEGLRKAIAAKRKK